MRPRSAHRIVFLSYGVGEVRGGLLFGPTQIAKEIMGAGTGTADLSVLSIG